MARTQAENKSHAEKQDSEEKIHGDALDAAVSSADHHESAGEHDSRSSRAKDSAIPAADNGAHARSQAAHLGGHTHDHTKPVGDLRKYEAEREPPQEVSRAGKDYRRQ